MKPWNERRPTGPVPGSQADFVAFTQGADTIYFDTDRYNVDSVDAAALQTQAQWLQRYPQKRATLEGHSDERGTREYNLALGQRRANSARDVLIALVYQRVTEHRSILASESLGTRTTSFCRRAPSTRWGSWSTA